MGKFLKNVNGATAIEYAVIAGLLSIVIIVSLQVISSSIQNTYSQIGSSMSTN